MTKRSFTRWKGRVKREIGEATGDRHVEAKRAIEAGRRGRCGESTDRARCPWRRDRGEAAGSRLV
jgi:hypothetical protein